VGGFRASQVELDETAPDSFGFQGREHRTSHSRPLRLRQHVAESDLARHGQHRESDNGSIAFSDNARCASGGDPGSHAGGRLVREPGCQDDGVATVIVDAAFSDRSPDDCAGGVGISRSSSANEWFNAT
jgi:hypothetical protein